MTDCVAEWRVGGEAGDADRAAAALSDEAILTSPLTEQFSFHGRDEIRDLLLSVFDAVKCLHLTHQFEADGDVILLATSHVRGRQLDEVQHLRLDPDGRIAHGTLYIRPLPALTAFMREIGPRIARRQGRRGVAAATAVASAMLDSMAATGDKRFVPLARPDSAR